MKPHYPVHPLAFHLSFPHHFKAKVEKKRFRGGEIVDDYTHMIYSMDLHILYIPAAPAHPGRRRHKEAKPMKMIFIHGPGAVGKLTVARELSKQTGIPVFHNHLVVDTLLSVFEFGSAPFVRLREKMWLGVFQEAAQAATSLIFTFAPEATVQLAFIPEAVRAVEDRGGQILFVKLTCADDERENRITAESRQEFKKLRCLETFRKGQAAGADRYPPLPDSGLTIDTTKTAPSESAALISAYFALPKLPHHRPQTSAVPPRLKQGPL